MGHRHKKISEITTPFVGPVGEGSRGYFRQYPAAHGYVTTVAICRCGAVRHTNENQGHVERGRWIETV